MIELRRLDISPNCESSYAPQPDIWYRGTIKLDEEGNISINAVSLERIDPITISRIRSKWGKDFLIPGFLFELAKVEDPMSKKYDIYSELRKNAGRSVQFTFRAPTDTNTNQRIQKIAINIYNEDRSQQKTINGDLNAYNISSVSNQ